MGEAYPHTATAIGRALLLGLAAAALLTVSTLITAQPADAEERAPQDLVTVLGPTVGCEGIGSDRVQLDYVLQNKTEVFGSIEPIDYRIVALGRPEIEPRVGQPEGVVFEALIFDGGMITAVVEVNGRVIQANTMTVNCDSDFATSRGQVNVTKSCKGSQPLYDFDLQLDPTPDADTPVDFFLGDEVFSVVTPPDRFSLLKREAGAPGDRVMMRRGNEVLLDVEDVYFECGPLATADNVDITVTTECRDSAVPGAVRVTATNRSKGAAQMSIAIAPAAVAPLRLDLAPGVTDSVVRTSRPDGPYTVTTSVGPRVIDETTVQIECNGPYATAVIDSTCVDGDGSIAAVVNAPPLGSPQIELAVSGLADKVAVLDPGELRTLRRTGRPDGTYEVVVRDRGVEIARSTIDVTCDPPPPVEVALSVDCADPRIVATVTNNTDASITYAIDVVEVEVAPLTGTIGAGDSETRVRTGRRDGTYTVVTSADGLVVSVDTVDVDCVPDPPLLSMVTHSCSGGDGVIEAQLVGEAVVGTTFTVSVSGLDDRIVTVGPQEMDVVRRSGRPDGTYDVAIRGAGFFLQSQVTIACDAVSQPSPSPG